MCSMKFGKWPLLADLTWQMNQPGKKKSEWDFPLLARQMPVVVVVVVVAVVVVSCCEVGVRPLGVLSGCGPRGEAVKEGVAREATGG